MYVTLLPRSTLAYFDGNRSYNLNLNILEKPYIYMSQISSKSVQQFESSQMFLSKIVN